MESLRKFPARARDRIIAKMDWFIGQEQPLHFAKKLSGRDEGRWRFRVGNYRIICERMDGQPRVLKVVFVGDRKNVYRGAL
ncbi:type II toxin-antitoxin system RelE/ParE family toxin [Candidatus Peribacteria bacterium]|nr:type II toxin-antitoxin system RelE/ParE family toxin [Candidatus Peribacteria bacterium]